ncbi:ABC transporter permease [Chitinophaga arvensicola]|uniref:ABC-type antimicrobial peptide transport system, permease component n=1 Tax=Chitinophaga arvensicola TaxID=29529 RepID=A0A1I0S7I6_9BACT|nr:ABC transporter permease [Chitinophaga arvensicola]SEW51729.1 ABC-type antimicrobial peptide transport system, permease component [Chitinophaga arvensicola]
MLSNYLKIAWRNLLRNKVYASINVIGLALGISACLVIYLSVQFELTYDNFHPGKENIYRVVSELGSPIHGIHKTPTVPDPAPEVLAKGVTGFETLAAIHTIYPKIKIVGDNGVTRKFENAEKPTVIITYPEYFKVFEYKWLAGQPATALEEPFKVVLTASTAAKYFGEQPAENYIGKIVTYNDSIPVSVSGIVKDLPQNTDFIFTDFISFATAKNSPFKGEFGFDQWGMFGGTQAFVRLSAGSDTAKINRQLAQLANERVKIGEGESKTFRLQPLSDFHFNSDYTDNYSRKAHLPTMYGLMAIAGFILVIAAINFINLSTAQSTARAKEVGIRKVLGSNKRSLVLYFLTETFILTASAVLLSLLAVKPLLSAFSAFMPNGVSMHLFSWPTLLFLLLLTLFTTLLSGLYPAKVLSSFQPASSLKGATGFKGNQRGYLRIGLVVFQFTISLVFIIGSLVINNQIRYMLHKDLGFRKDAILTFNTNRAYPNSQPALLAEKIQSFPQVEMVSLSQGPPSDNNHWGTFLKYRGGAGEMAADCHLEFGDTNYIKLYQLKLLAGRNLYASDTIKEVLINESCAKALGFKTPHEAIGKFVEPGMSDGPYRKNIPIAGVLADFHAVSLRDQIKPVFILTSKDICRFVNVKLSLQGHTGAQLQQTIADIGKAYAGIYPDEKFEYNFFDETIRKFYERERQMEQLMNTGMTIAIVISCLGLFGLAAFTARQRTKEIGIRKVMGASVGNITALLSKDFLRYVFIAALLASPIAWYGMHKWLQGFAYSTPLSWWIFVLAGGIALLIALLTVSFQSVKAALANPVESLKAE